MSLKFEYKRELEGYSRETILVFSDDAVFEEDIPKIEVLLNDFNYGIYGEVVDFQVLFEENKLVIYMVIICFKTLLTGLTRYKYNKFIEKYEKDFIKFYISIYRFLG